MTRRHVLGCLVCAAARLGRSAVEGVRLYAHSFQGGILYAFDLGAQRTVWTLPLTNKTAMAAVGVSEDRRWVFAVDGAGPDRLRVVEAASGGVVSEAAFQDRVRSLGGAPAMHVMRGGSLVLIKTYHLSDAAQGVLLYDWQRRVFLPVGLRGRECGAPVFASAEKGVLFGACAGVVERWQTNGAVAGDPPVAGTALMSIREPVAAAAAADGGSVFVLEAVPQGGPWRLAEWRTGEGRVRERDLDGVLQPAGDGRQAWLDVAPDGRTVAIADGRRVWLLAGDGLGLRRTIELPTAASGLAFLPGGRELVMLDGSRPAWLVAEAAGGTVREIPFRGAAGSVRPWQFH